ncbi:polyhydroxyalkanoate depolymerase [Luteimonas sp. MC1750]|uniref:polyhydroxyalkanoate depolymerase n=1 Tax=Luteimonas sp. MC1750 TaxID=2799326 RepID=UPI0018F0CC95|nr:polyhydroxyalkanoate depolymerase [Luteimonas sp. MC1750]MBJ6983771.1 polyhydroxyalkanoate depolymerase [Luteimonas sp. MC1750]QQO06601.1 polyhydroxyalkanoate depolymerase [Luteimonas sp. MC1750]
MIYQLHEFNRQLLAPFTELAQANARIFGADGTWLSSLPGATRLAAGNELLHRIGKDYEKPPFAIHQVVKDGHDVPVVEKVALDKPFCRLLRFKRYTDDAENILGMKDQPTVLVVAPLSGHHATLLRDTVRTLLPDHKVYITDWVDARMVPKEAGAFTLDDYVGYIQEFIRHIGASRLHVVSVCQPTVPVLAAISLMASRGEDMPRSMVMMGGPIDTRSSPTAVNNLAATRPLSWFEQNVIHVVPQNYPGRGRRVYPGFLQHTGFVAMNPERHFMSHWDFYQDLVKGDLDDAQSHRRFYDEYNAVLDMPAEYYLDTIRVVFQQQLLPQGAWDVAGERVDPAAIRGCALMTIEGELDDISGLGQTRAAHALCTGIAEADRRHLTVEGAGHYGIFSGRRWRTQVYPQVRDFIAGHDTPAGAARPLRNTGRS